MKGPYSPPRNPAPKDGKMFGIVTYGGSPLRGPFSLAMTEPIEENSIVGRGGPEEKVVAQIQPENAQGSDLDQIPAAPNMPRDAATITFRHGSSFYHKVAKTAKKTQRRRNQSMKPQMNTDLC